MKCNGRLSFNKACLGQVQLPSLALLHRIQQRAVKGSLEDNAPVYRGDIRCLVAHSAHNELAQTHSVCAIWVDGGDEEAIEVIDRLPAADCRRICYILHLI